MDRRNVLRMACERLGVESGQVLSYRVYEDHIALVVDKGIAGCPKYKVPLSELIDVKYPKQEAEPPNATDSAVQLAAEHDIDLETVEGTGKGGKIVKSDVEALL